MMPRMVQRIWGIVLVPAAALIFWMAAHAQTQTQAPTEPQAQTQPQTQAQPPTQTQAPAVPKPHRDRSIEVVMGGDFPPLPRINDPADDADTIRENYEFAAHHPEIVQYMPCFCACGRDKIHKSLQDCYIKSRGATDADIVWTNHGGECMICLTVAKEARRLALAGKSLTEIRAEIEELGHRFKYHTDTPMPPPQGTPQQ
jgi:hypothetical protein